MNVDLCKITSGEIFSAFIIIKRGFFRTFLTYFDSISPVLESFPKFKRKFQKNNVSFFWIINEGEKVGIIEVKHFEEYLQISDFAVLHKFQNIGIGKAAVKELFKQYKNADTYQLFTIKQDKRNCHFYESLGFGKTGKEHRINQRMTLIEYIISMR